MKCGVVKSLCKCISQLIGFCDEEIKKWHKSSRSAKETFAIGSFRVLCPDSFYRLI
jgi:hypothetical protein